MKQIPEGTYVLSTQGLHDRFTQFIAKESWKFCNYEQIKNVEASWKLASEEVFMYTEIYWCHARQFFHVITLPYI